MINKLLDMIAMKESDLDSLTKVYIELHYVEKRDGFKYLCANYKDYPRFLVNLLRLFPQMLVNGIYQLLSSKVEDFSPLIDLIEERNESNLTIITLLADRVEDVSCLFKLVKGDRDYQGKAIAFLLSRAKKDHQTLVDLAFNASRSTIPDCIEAIHISMNLDVKSLIKLTQMVYPRHLWRCVSHILPFAKGNLEPFYELFDQIKPRRILHLIRLTHRFMSNEKLLYFISKSNDATLVSRMRTDLTPSQLTDAVLTKDIPMLIERLVYEVDDIKPLIRLAYKADPADIPDIIETLTPFSTSHIPDLIELISLCKDNMTRPIQFVKHYVADPTDLLKLYCKESVRIDADCIESLTRLLPNPSVLIDLMIERRDIPLKCFRYAVPFIRQVPEKIVQLFQGQPSVPFSELLPFVDVGDLISLIYNIDSNANLYWIDHLASFANTSELDQLIKLCTQFDININDMEMFRGVVSADIQSLLPLLQGSYKLDTIRMARRNGLEITSKLCIKEDMSEHERQLYNLINKKPTNITVDSAIPNYRYKIDVYTHILYTGRIMYNGRNVFDVISSHSSGVKSNLPFPLMLQRILEDDLKVSYDEGFELELFMDQHREELSLTHEDSVTS